MRDLPGQDLSADRQAQSFPRVNAGFIKHVPVAHGGLCGHVRTCPATLCGARPGRTTPPIRFPPPPPASADKPVLASQRPGVALAKTGFRPRLALARRSASARRHDGALALLLALSLRISFGLTSRLGENLAWGLSPHKFCAMPRTHVAHNLPAKACEAGCSGSG